MRRRVVLMMFGLILAAGSVGAAEQDAPVCKRANVNPVTGQVFCIDPLGAEVAPPPQAEPCKAGAHAGDGDWTWRPGCTESKGS
ncbi:MAG TPA: hypothetical protein VMW68_04010 [Methyloceanibacter sp.]|nr:hypothetical protein [Methyloceanibacter sp.]